MAFHHHNHRHHHHELHQPIITSTTSSSSCSCCCDCQPPPCQPYLTPPSPTPDPYTLASIVAQLLQTPTPSSPNHFHPPTLKPTNVSRNHRYPLGQTPQFQDPHAGVLSLVQRIDALEAALHRLSCSSSLSVRHAAARTIQTHFRAYLVRRSRALRHLKELASVKSAIVGLKGSISRRGFVDFEFLSSRAMDLLHHVDSIQGDDQMVTDSKRAITKEIDQFLDSLDGMYVQRHQVITKTVKKGTRSSGNGNRIVHEHGREFSEHVGRSKCGKMSNDEKKLLENLKARAERIGRLSRELEDNEEEDEEEIEGYDKHIGGSDEDGNYIVGNPSKHGRENGGFVKKNALVDSILRGKKHVTFVEDGNAVRVYDIDENGSRDVNEVEGSTRDVQDKDEEAWNHVV